jgi:DNA-binding winged helix-turn-helix (wHTH) protein/TolB-like protein/Flp pilus assembly protein TadD
MPLPRYYQFQGFRLDVLQRQLRDPQGHVVELPTRAFDTLVYLLQHHGEDVSKERLMQAVWPGTVVEENNLSQAITVLRRAFGDKRTAPRFLMTVPGRGYRFIAELSESAAAATAEAGSSAAPLARRPRAVVWLASLAVLVAAALAVRALWPAAPPDAADSLAVLPFTPLVVQQGDPALELGMAETLITHISTLPGVAVRPIGAVRRYATPEQDPHAAGRELGVAIVLAGSIQTRGDRIRVASRLIRIADGRTLWSERFDARMSTIFDVQDAIAEAVMSTLADQLGAAPPEHSLPRATENPEAYRWYLSGVYNRQRHALPAAAANFRAATAEDPHYAQAWSSLSAMLAAMGVFNMQPPDAVYPEAKAAARRALEINSGLAEAHAALGHVLVQYEARFAEGESLYKTARELDPGNGLIRLWTSINFLHLGRGAEALEQARLAQALEPGTLPFAAQVAMVLYHTRAYDDAVAELQRLLQLQPQFDHARSLLGRALLAQGEYDAALGHFQARRSPSPGSFGDIGRAYAAMGKRSDAYAEIDELRRRGRDGFAVSYDIASIHAMLGEVPEACAALLDATRERSMSIGLLPLDPAFDRLRDAPCYQHVAVQDPLLTLAAGSSLASDP